MTKNVTADQVKAAVQKAGMLFVRIHDCSICFEGVGYIINGDNIYYSSACGCSWAPVRQTDWQEAADHINMQKRNHPEYGDVAAKAAKKFGLEL